MSTESADALARFHAELDLVDLIARQLGRRVSRSVTLDELRSFGREGLLQAARSFDPALGKRSGPRRDDGWPKAVGSSPEAPLPGAARPGGGRPRARGVRRGGRS